MEEAVAVVSVGKTAEPLNLEKINREMAEKAKANPVKQEKKSKLDQINKELKKIEKQQNVNQDPVAEGKGKSQFGALLLAILVGAIGIHLFYLGYTTIGIIQLLTLGGCGVWALIGLIRIAMGDLKPVDWDYEETL